MEDLFGAKIIMAKNKADVAREQYEALLKICDHTYANGCSANHEGVCNLCKQKLDSRRV